MVHLRRCNSDTRANTVNYYCGGDETELHNLKGRVWELHKLILNDGRWFPETADVIFFSEKFVF